MLIPAVAQPRFRNNVLHGIDENTIVIPYHSRPNIPFTRMQLFNDNNFVRNKFDNATHWTYLFNYNGKESWLFI